jgi:Prp8 binding protein
MASEKRPASEDFGSSQMVVKRPNLGNNSKAVAIANGSGANGALIQAVCSIFTGTVRMLAEDFERISY